MGQIFGILTFPLLILLMGVTAYYSFSHRNRELESSSEIAGRAVLVCTFFLTLWTLFGITEAKREFPDIPMGILLLNGMGALIYFVVQFLSSANYARDSQVRLLEARQKSRDDPASIRYAWELSSAILEDYLNMNLSQVKWIFNVAVFVMLCGFIVVCYGVSLAITNNIKGSVATSSAGIITQFVGATLVIYRSTMA
jgi:hypothetical protein